MKHKTKNRAQKVQNCTNIRNGVCQYSAETCWFKHDKVFENEDDAKKGYD